MGWALVLDPLMAAMPNTGLLLVAAGVAEVFLTVVEEEPSALAEDPSAMFPAAMMK